MTACRTHAPVEPSEASVDAVVDAAVDAATGADATETITEPSVTRVTACTPAGASAPDITLVALEGTLWQGHHCYLDLDGDRCFAFWDGDGGVERINGSSVLVLGDCSGIRANHRGAGLSDLSLGPVPRVRMEGRLSVTTARRTRKVAITPSKMVVLSPADAGTTVVVPPAKGDVTIGSLAMSAPVANAEAGVARMRPQFRACYNKGLEKDPGMAGSVVLAITVDSTGEVEAVTKTGGSGLSADVEQCMMRGARHAFFDAPGGAGSLITVPVTLTKE